MTNEKINEVLDRYEVLLREGVDDEGVLLPPPQRDHLRGMIPKLRAFVAAGQRDKAFRWLGFMQGAFWVLGCYTIDEMRDHNRSEPV